MVLQKSFLNTDMLISFLLLLLLIIIIIIIIVVSFFFFLRKPLAYTFGIFFLPFMHHGVKQNKREQMYCMFHLEIGVHIHLLCRFLYGS